MFAHTLFHEHITRRKWLALAVNILGCSLTATGGHLSSAVISAAWIGCGLASGFCYGMTAVIAYLLYYRGVQKIRDNSRVPVLPSVECVVAVGIALVLGSVLLMNSGTQKPPAHEQAVFDWVLTYAVAFSARRSTDCSG